LCEWWLTLIETEANNFLQKHGFVKDSLPFNYLSVPPPDLEVVKSNYSLIQQMMKCDCKEMDELLIRVTNEVYSVLDEFIEDTKFTLEFQAKDGISYEKFEQYKTSLEMDVEYLTKMKQMDVEIQERRASGNVEACGKMEMTDVVPIGGLIMARIHILECEMRTALERWDKKKKVEIEVPKVNPLSQSGTFGQFFGNLEAVDTEQQEIAACLMTPRPAYAPESCVNVLLMRKEQKSKVRLGHARVKKSGKAKRSKNDQPSPSICRSGSDICDPKEDAFFG